TGAFPLGARPNAVFQKTLVSSQPDERVSQEDETACARPAGGGPRWSEPEGPPPRCHPLPCLRRRRVAQSAVVRGTSRTRSAEVPAETRTRRVIWGPCGCYSGDERAHP